MTAFQFIYLCTKCTQNIEINMSLFRNHSKHECKLLDGRENPSIAILLITLSFKIQSYHANTKMFMDFYFITLQCLSQCIPHNSQHILYWRKSMFCSKHKSMIVWFNGLVLSSSVYKTKATALLSCCGYLPFILRTSSQGFLASVSLDVW
jgi:hypothetical protein